MSRENPNDSTAIDGMVCSYLVDAISGACELEELEDQRLCEQHIATVRLFLWGVEL